MFIKEIELNNFRIYKGNNKISLLPSDNKNIILISGKNGFGKTTGLPQIMELGTLESYICLTNTLNVGVVQQALVDIMVKENEDLTSVNVVVGECNDGYLNSIRDCVVTKEDVYDITTKP